MLIYTYIMFMRAVTNQYYIRHTKNLKVVKLIASLLFVTDLMSLLLRIA